MQTQLQRRHVGEWKVETKPSRTNLHDLLSNKELSLVVPKIVLGGERLSFALSIKRSPTQDTNHDAELNINNQKPDNGEHDEAAAPESDPAVSKEGSRNGQEESP